MRYANYKSAIILLSIFFTINSNATLPPISELTGDYDPPTSFIEGLGSNGINWHYHTTEPAPGWASTSFQQTQTWSQGYGGFYDGSTSPEEENNTPFNNNIWLRGSVSLSSSDLDQFMLWGKWDDQVEIYINGVLAASRDSWVDHYQYIGISPASRETLHAGTNIIAVKAVNAGGPGFFNLAVARNTKLVNPPVIGFSKSKDLKWVTEYIKSIVAQNTIPASTLAITRQNGSTMEVIYSAGFGYMDKQQTRKVPQNAVLRLASTDKTPTWVAMRNMILDDGSCSGFGLATTANSLTATNPATMNDLKCSDKVYDILATVGVFLPSDNIPNLVKEITISHLLEYKGFFKARPNGENPTEVSDYYTHLGITSEQSSSRHLMRWYFTNPTQQTPGSDCLNENNQVVACYNSDGAAVARYIIDEVQSNLESYLQNTLMVNSQEKDIFIAAEEVSGRQLFNNNLLREPWYRTEKDPYPFWIGLEDALALSASAATLATTFPTFGYGHNWGRGKMRGTVTLVDPLTLSGGKNGGVAWLNSGDSYKATLSASEIITDTAFDFLTAELESLPTAHLNTNNGVLKHIQSGLCVHPSGGSSNPTDGTNVILYNECTNQNRLKYSYSTKFGLKQISSGKCMHPEGGSEQPANGTRVVLWSECDQKKTDFKIMLDGTLTHIPSGKCVTPDSSNQLRLQSCSGSNNKFEFID